MACSKPMCHSYIDILCFHSLQQLSIGQIVMANYNPDEPEERGFWYDVEITKKVSDL